MTPQDDEDPVVRLLKQTYQAPPPDRQFAQSLADRLQQQMKPVGKSNSSWRLGLALAACLLLGAVLVFWASRQRSTGDSEREAIRPEPPPTVPQTMPDEIRPTR